MKISVSSYSFMQYIRDGRMTLLDTVSKAKELGLEAIEFIDLPGATLDEQKSCARELRAEADRLGMTINSYTVGGNLYKNSAEEDRLEIERLKGQVDIAAILGVPVMRHDCCYHIYKEGNGRSFDLMLPTIASHAREITEYAAEKGIKTCCENHGYIAQDSDRMERLFNAVNHENFGLLVDMGNFCCVDEDSVTAVSRVAPYAIHAHAKDMHLSSEPQSGYGQTRGCNYFKGAVIGNGDIDVDRCIKILKRAGYDGYLSIEFEGSEDCIESIKAGFEYLKSRI